MRPCEKKLSVSRSIRTRYAPMTRSQKAQSMIMCKQELGVKGQGAARGGRITVTRHHSLFALRLRPAWGAVLIGLCVSSPALPQPASTGTWTTKAPMSAVRGEVAAAVFENKLYALGGNVGGNAVPRNEEYDPATDRWRSRAALPAPRDQLGVAVVNGKIYTFGGFVK